MNIDLSFNALLELAIEEDLGSLGDITSQVIFSDEPTIARLYSKDIGILAGARYFSKVFERIDPSVKIEFNKQDGDELKQGDIVAVLNGKALSILSGERISLNFLAYLSGIATATKKIVNAAEGRTTILDTRKTLPGYRSLAKWAVLHGGATNHRMGLYDMVMIKDNHIDAAGGITEAVKKVRDAWSDKFRIEVECRTIEEVKEALENNVDVIMLDNMDTDTVSASLNLKNGNVAFEASGDMNEEKVSVYSGLGVDYISVGQLTHSVRSFDFSLQIDISAG